MNPHGLFDACLKICHFVSLVPGYMVIKSSLHSCSENRLDLVHEDLIPAVFVLEEAEDDFAQHDGGSVRASTDVRRGVVDHLRRSHDVWVFFDCSLETRNKVWWRARVNMLGMLCNVMR